MDIFGKITGLLNMAKVQAEVFSSDDDTFDTFSDSEDCMTVTSSRPTSENTSTVPALTTSTSTVGIGPVVETTGPIPTPLNALDQEQQKSCRYLEFRQKARSVQKVLLETTESQSHLTSIIIKKHPNENFTISTGKTILYTMLRAFT